MGEKNEQQLTDRSFPLIRDPYEDTNKHHAQRTDDNIGNVAQRVVVPHARDRARRVHAHASRDRGCRRIGQ